MGELNIYGWIALVAVILGGLCLGLIGLFNVQLLTALFGNLVGRLLYIAIGVAAGYLCYLFYLKKMKRV